jgi:hypothetical protein
MFSDVLTENVKGRDHLVDLGVYGRIILKSSFRESMKTWNAFI